MYLLHEELVRAIVKAMDFTIMPVFADVFEQDTAGGTVFRINPVLLPIMKERGVYTEEVMRRISEDQGSIQGESWLSDHEKLVFRTAFEINQETILRMAAQRQPYVDQGQSVNLYFTADEDERERRRNENPEGVASPPVPPAEGGFSRGQPAQHDERGHADGGAHEAAQGRGGKQQADDGIRGVEGDRKTDPAPGHECARDRLERGAGPNVQRQQQAAVGQPGMKARVDVGDDRAGKNCRPDAVAVDEHRREGDPGGRKQWRDVARRDRDVQRQNAAQRIGDGDSKLGAQAVQGAHRAVVGSGGRRRKSVNHCNRPAGARKGLSVRRSLGEKAAGITVFMLQCGSMAMPCKRRRRGSLARP